MPLRILLAEDHLIVRQGVKQLLTREGYSVVAEAADGREAVRLAQEHCPDIAVLDLGMPLLNGVDAARQILKVSPSTKAILLTFKKEVPYVLEAFRAGAKGYVLKTHGADRKSTRLNSSHSQISYAVFCLKKKKKSQSEYT